MPIGVHLAANPFADHVALAAAAAVEAALGGYARGQRPAPFRSTQLKFAPPSAHNPRLILCPRRSLSHKEDRLA